MGRRGRTPEFDDPARAVDEELRFHLERRTEELMGEGWSPDDARRRAREEFGDLEATRAYCAAQDRARMSRATALRSLTDDVRAALRGLARRPGSVVGPVAVLATAVTLNVLVFTVVRGVLLAPLPVADEARTWVLEERQDGGGLVRASYPVLATWAREAGSFEVVAGHLETALPMVVGDRPVHVSGASVTSRFFDLLPDPFLMGEAFGAGHHAPGGPETAILSENLWRRAFGARPDVIGSVVRLGDAPRTIRGVVRAEATFPDGADFWLPVESTNADLVEIAGAKIFVGLGRLRPGVDPAAASTELATLSASVPGGAPDARMEPLRARLLGDVEAPLLLLQGAVLLVLLAACANAGGMLLTRAVRRQADLAVRISLGAGPGRVGRSLLIEGLLLGGAAGAAGVAGAAILLRPTLALVPTDLPRAGSLGLDASVALVGLALAVGTGVLTSLVPLIGALRHHPAHALRQTAGRSGSSPWLRRLQDGFVVGQVALATVLTVGAGLLLRSFVETVREDPGFDTARVTVLELALPSLRYPDGEARLAFAEELLRRADALPGAEAVALGQNLPISGSNMTSPLMVDGRDGPTDAVQIAAVTDGYFEVLGIPLVSGASFGTADRAGAPPTLVVDAALRDAAGLGPGDRARSFFGSSAPREVVGVAGAVRHAGLRTAPEPIAYEPFFQRGGSAWFTLLVRSTAPPGVVAEAARSMVASLDPELPTDRVGTMDGRLDASLAEPRFYTVGLGVFGVLAVVLALAGCQAGLAQRVAARRREMGLRIALGATTRRVRSDVVGRGLALTGAGAFLGVAAALPASRVLESQLYGVAPTDVVTYACLIALLLAAAAVTADVPARRAARVDPARVLRED